jgi:tetratricopeptide (TPR) repeat protein
MAGGAEGGVRGRVVAVACAVAIAAVYANSLSIPFQFDDWQAISANPFVRSLRNVPRFFVDPSTTSALLQNRDLRPVLQATFALNYAISGYQTWSWHLVNMVLHWVAALLVFRIVRARLWLGADGPIVGATAALLVAVHPLNTEALDYLSARSALLTTVFYLGAFDAAAGGRRALATALFALALLTKGIAVTFPLVVLGWLLVARAAEPGSPRPIPWPFLALLVAVDGAALGYRALLVPHAAIAGTHAAEVTPWVYCMTEWSAYLHYLRLFLWPDALVVDRLDYPLATRFLDPRACGSLAVLAVLIGLAWAARRRRPALAFAAHWYFVTLAAESSVFPLAEPVNEHRPYLAMLGLATAAATAVWAASRRVARSAAAPPSAVLAVVLVTLLGALGARTVARNRTWQDADTLWSDAAEKAPANPRAWLNSGHAAMERGDRAEARRRFLASYRLSPCYAWVLINLSVLERAEHDSEAALRWADEAVRCNPGLAVTHHYRGAALVALGRTDDALAAFRQATAIDARYAAAWFEQGRLLEERRAWPAGAAAFDRAGDADPANAEAAMRAALLHHHRLHDPAGAVERYHRVLAADPKHYGAHY